MSSELENDRSVTCPYCGDNVSSLETVNEVVRQKLSHQSAISDVPEKVCRGCLSLLGNLLTKASSLRSEQMAKEKNRLILWRNRVNLVKQARSLMLQASFASAAVYYEKYLKILELVYEKKSGMLTPELFRSASGGQEMTVIASVYWDLIRIYDSNPKFKQRQILAAQKLAEFVPFSPIYARVVRKAEVQMRSAKNPDVYKKFLKLSKANRPRCFIATAAFDSYDDWTVQRLVLFRDQYLKKNTVGRRFVVIYYRYSPSFAQVLNSYFWLKPIVRQVLYLVALGLHYGCLRKITHRREV